jgi:RNA polymerase sigma factor (sigma-70 family)
MNDESLTAEAEQALLRRFASSGDPQAFSVIARHYAGLVYGTCLRITGNEERAADTAQETFFHLARHGREVTGSLAGWLHRVAIGKSVNLVRSEIARRRREQAYAAVPRETDQWNELSPLVDEAMIELEEESREILVRYYLDGETLTAIAAAKGISQPTASRRVEAALEQLRIRLKSKGVLVTALALGGLMGNATTSAPAAVFAELGKMALTTSGSAAASTATATVLSINTKLAIAVVIIAVVGVGGFVAYKTTRSSQSPATATAISTAPAPVGGTMGAQGLGGRAANPRSMAVAVVNSGPPPTRATTDGALTLFSMALVRGDLAQLEECFAGAAEAEAFRQVWENPMDDAQRQLQRVFKSVGPRIEVGEVATTAEGLKVKWIARVRQPFTTTENGIARTWQRGDRYELETRLKQVGGEWKIVGF